MSKLKKTIWVGLTGISGLLLTLAGFSLIDLSAELIKYTGIVLLCVAILFYILPEGRKKDDLTKEVTKSGK